MTLWSYLAYAADAWIIGAYAATTRDPRRLRWFHWANALGCVPLLVVELVTHAYPVIPITGTFGLLGWIGVAKDTL